MFLSVFLCQCTVPLYMVEKALYQVLYYYYYYYSVHLDALVSIFSYVSLKSFKT